MGDLIGFIPSVHHPQLINCCIPSSQIASPPITENYNFGSSFGSKTYLGGVLQLYTYIFTYIHISYMRSVVDCTIYYNFYLLTCILLKKGNRKEVNNFTHNLLD